MLASGGLAGLAGGIYVHLLPVEIDSLSLDLTFITLAMLVIGGMTSLAGALVGTVFMVTLPELLRGYVNLQQIMFGAILFATMAFLPGGLIEAGRRLKALFSGRRPSPAA